MHQDSKIVRRVSKQIMVGAVPVGGDAPIAVQSMTNTNTLDVAATVAQIRRLEVAGADIVRVSVPSMDAAEAFGKIRAQVDVPLVSDIHFDYKIALKVAALGVDCLRINPGNIGSPDRVRAVVSACKDQGIPIRIGVNAGSLGKDLMRKYKEPNATAMVESALRNIEMLDAENFDQFKLSLKASDIFMTIEAYQRIAGQIDQPLHLGITEAGALRSGTVKSAAGLGFLLMAGIGDTIRVALRSGTVKSAAGLGFLLMAGIGDTIRVSLAADPVEEVKVGFDLLKSLHLRSKGIHFVACPSCSRQNFDVISTVNELERRVEDITTPLDVAIIGCIVNGPGEAKEADIGLTGATPNNLIYRDGAPSQKVTNEHLIDDLEAMIRRRVAEKIAAEAAENVELTSN